MGCSVCLTFTKGPTTASVTYFTFTDVTGTNKHVHIHVESKHVVLVFSSCVETVFALRCV